MSILFVDDCIFNDYCFNWYILVIIIVVSFYIFDFFYYVYISGYFIKYIVVLIVYRFVVEVKEIIVFYVNEELCGSWVWIVSMGYGNGVCSISNVVVGFVFNRIFGGFLFYIWCYIVVLNYKIVDYVVENGIVVEVVFYVR